MKLLCKLLKGTLHSDWSLRFSAREAGTHKFFMRVFLSKEHEAQAASESGIVIPGGTPEWDIETRGSDVEHLKPLSMKRKDDSHGLGVYAVESYEIGETVTWYSGRSVFGNDGNYLFSEHVQTIAQGHQYLDGSYGSGAWPVERLQKERCAGAALNSNRTKPKVHRVESLNCVLDKHKAVWGRDGVLRVPLKTIAKVSGKDQLYHSYPFGNARSASFRKEESDSEDW